MGTSVFWIFTLSVISVLSLSHAQPSCFTPLNKLGVCDNLRKCPAMLQLLLQAGSLSLVEEYLKKSICGGDITDPKVCCPAHISVPELDSTYENTETQYQPELNGILTHPLLPKNCGGGTSRAHEKYPETASIDDFPWLAILEWEKFTDNHKKVYCTGTLISDRYVLTTANCIEENKNDHKLERVVLGEYDRGNSLDCAQTNLGPTVCADEPLVSEIIAIIVHEDFGHDRHGLRNDIALIRLSKSVKFTNFIQPICLPSNDHLPQKFVSTGWGLTGSSFLSRKYKNTLPLVGKDICTRDYRGVFDNLLESHICVGVDRKYIGCQRDRGSPLMTYEENAYTNVGRWITKGIFSFGTPDCGITADRASGIYTNVHHYTRWITSHLVAG